MPVTGWLIGDHPRIRGEHVFALSIYFRSVGSSPHTRGAQVPEHRHARRGGGSSPHTRGARSGRVCPWSGRRIIPAYAGSTGYDAWWTVVRADHPRIRGEHVRGVRLRKGRRWIIPAYAGSTAHPAGSVDWTRDHPRIRGEHSTPPDGTVLDPGSSPHTRGALRPRNPDPALLRIIPAYAGST